MIVTINLPELYINALAVLIDAGEFPSRSETIRVSLSGFLQKELALAGKLLDLEEVAIKDKQHPKKRKTNIDMRSIRTGW